MTIVELKFISGRYHGTAWGRHVNEGLGEWPPSPYRLIRAMYDAWRRKCNDLTEADVTAVLAALAQQAPIFDLPPAIAAHTRSYLNSNTEDASQKALIFDGFVSMPKGSACFLRWNFDLPARERRNLELLLSSLNYLGRSESWVDARLTDSGSGLHVWRPLDSSGTDSDVIKVACPVPVSEYKLKKPSWLEALAVSSGAVQKDHLSGPPAMRYVSYGVPESAITTWLPVHSKAAKQRHLSAAILELNGKVLPGVGDTVRVAERVRGRLMRYFEARGGKGSIPSMVHGKEEGSPLKDHSHLFILPRANLLGRIDHVLIYTEWPSGFVDGLDDALAEVRSIRWVDSVRCALSWTGPADDRLVRPLSKRVRTSTPFATVRHWRKGRGEIRDFIEQEIRRECSNRLLPKHPCVRLIEMPQRLTKFRRSREGEASLPGYAAEIEFPEPVHTPFSLGYASHFGLGQFEAV